MDVPIGNINDLRNEILRLKGQEREQSVAIGLRFKNFSSTISTLGSLFPRSFSADGKSTGFFDQDLVGLISRFVLPFTLNKTIFRHSGFLVKALVGLVSQKASHFISEDSVMGLWDKIKTLFAAKEKKSKNPERNTIPPLSETY
ncbi:hypothetical protein [Mucilaginibacter sp.]|uniref:hypothetical protein n=1 Tax=Mucilaginibacter sp. TaxID=1882438 RepID=UPI00261741E6|nr:hypothetical protein [Mucilaginibacter sp.]MDB4918686.1 hypothetical protein [Mucilaginibacter sp.]